MSALETPMKAQHSLLKHKWQHPSVGMFCSAKRYSEENLLDLLALKLTLNFLFLYVNFLYFLVNNIS